MQVKITKVEEYTEGVLVSFKVEYGEGFGIWNGNKRPVEGESYDLELDITEPVKWGGDIVVSKEKVYRMSIQEGAVSIVGKLQKVASNGLADILIGDSIIQLEVEGKASAVGNFVEVRTNDIELYPY